MRGPIGASGAQGERGPSGPRGLPGADGPVGPKGLKSFNKKKLIGRLTSNTNFVMQEKKLQEFCQKNPNVHFLFFAFCSRSNW